LITLSEEKKLRRAKAISIRADEPDAMVASSTDASTINSAEIIVAPILLIVLLSVRLFG
jgi:hypothetical protein